MLVLSRKHNETLHIGNDVVITIVRVRGDSVRIGIQAPKDVHIMRSELLGTPAKQADNPANNSTSTLDLTLEIQLPKKRSQRALPSARGFSVSIPLTI